MTNPDDENNSTSILGTTSTSTSTTSIGGGLLSGGVFGNTGINSSNNSSNSKTESGVAPDEDCSKEYEPVVRLAEVETKTGEEDEEILYKNRAKLFRFSKELGEWKERGTGDVRILKHKVTKKIRLLMRREKTLKICLNHYVNPIIELKENVGSDRSWVWHGVDYADGEADHASLAIRFRDSSSAEEFKKNYDEARQHMSNLTSNTEKTENGKEEEEAEKEEQKEQKEQEEKKEEEEEKE